MRATATSTRRACASCPRGAAADRARTSCSGERERARAYERIAEELRAGRQAFVVCPLVEEGERGRARAAQRAPRPRSSSACARGELRELRLVLLHGQLRHREKQEAMAAFARR